MKHTRLIDVPATTKTVVSRVTCDLCGKRVETQDRYEIDEVTISHKTGSSYPEGGSGEIASVDMCSDCFNEKLVPWLKTQGAAIQTEDWDR